MTEATGKTASGKRVILLAGDTQRRQLIGEHPQAALVSETLPLRANLSVIENISVVLQFRTNSYLGEAEDVARRLLDKVGCAGCADRRDPDLSYEERFIAKLLRAVVLSPPIILIDRPAQLLPDCNYPVFLHRALSALDNRIEQCWILDYEWNAPLYRKRA